jgi:hypothetical protein
LNHKGAARGSGLRLYEIETVIEKSAPYSLLLTSDIQVGCQGFIDFSHENERIVFQGSYEQIEIIPLLHRNTMSFIGMKERNSFLATKVIDGKFVALSDKGKLYSWDLITGKLFVDEKHAPKFKQYKDFEIYKWIDEDEEKEDNVYKKEWYSKILLKKKNPIANFDDSNYHGHGGSEDHIENQVTYNHSFKREFFEFRVIEITSDREVTEHLSFVHCLNMEPTTVHYIYFSEDLSTMYERLKHERHFLYKREQPKHRLTENKNEVAWHQVHRFHHLPLDVLNVTEYPFIFSPNFKYYLDLDETHVRFIIRDPLNHEKIVYHVPEEIMSARNEKLEDVVRRFRWLTENLIHVINHEGIERIIDVANDFKELEFNFIPLYDPEVCKKTHYMLDSPSYNLDESLKTLKKRYQYYKSAYYLQQAMDPDFDMYNEIFRLDYRIDNCNGQFEVDMSFSFLHWSLIE